VDGAVSGRCPIAGFSVSGVDLLPQSKQLVLAAKIW
jgi:hypothetical protein